jgi:hypothetical protein
MTNNSTNGPFDDAGEWPCLNALSYDSEEAANYISEQTGIPIEKARSFIIACDEYELLLGTVPIYDEDNVQRILRLRVEYSNLIPKDTDHLDYNLLFAYVEGTTEFTSAEVANMIAENICYYVRQGIMEPEAYEEARAWAHEIMIATPPQ